MSGRTTRGESRTASDNRGKNHRMIPREQARMKCPKYDTTKVKKMEKNPAVESKAPLLLASPVKMPPVVLTQTLSAAPSESTLLPLNHTSSVHDKENSSGKEYDRTPEDVAEDSGYLSLHNSQIDHHTDEEDELRGCCTLTPSAPVHPDRLWSTRQSTYQRTAGCVSAVAASTPVNRLKCTKGVKSLSFTPTKRRDDPNLPLLKFQQAVCEELSKNYQKNKRYDWSIITKVAEGHLLDRVIGGKMGLDYVDMFSSLLCRNMKGILTNILSLLGDLDLVSCKKVSRTWRKIIYEDTAAMKRCLQGEHALQESGSSLKQKACLTRDVTMSRMVLSCMQTLASQSSTSPFSSSCGINRRASLSQKGSKSTTQSSNFKDYVQAASTLKQHESLRPCKRCGSPAIHSPEVQRARCTRQSCLFDFCTCCQEAFHGSAPCRTVQPRAQLSTANATTIIPGSTRSKRNIRRL